MAFMMNVSSCQVTSVSNGLNGRAGEYVQALSTEPKIISADLTPAYKSELAFKANEVSQVTSQSVASTKITGNGKEI